MKVREPSISGSFIGYLQYLQNELHRKLTDKERQMTMQNYIHGISAKQTLELFK